MSKRKKQKNFGDVKRATAKATKPASGMTYYTLVVIMRDGKPEFRRFHMQVDARTLPAHEQEKFVGWVLRSVGISPEDMADLGSDPCVKVEAFDAEHEAKSHYDWLLREFGPVVPGAGALADKFAAYVNSPGGTG